jgi:hypothetical protein
MKTIIALTLFTLSASGLSVADTAVKPAEGAESPVPSANPQKRYEAKTKSGFHYETPRAPFTPIGYVKSAAAPTTNAPAPVEIKLDESQFRVTSILLGNPAIAVINGRSYEEGQYVRVPKGAALRPRVFRIMDGQVIIQAESKSVTVPLRRGELNERRPEDELLNEDRD